jgi:hypothetical protein
VVHENKEFDLKIKVDDEVAAKVRKPPKPTPRNEPKLPDSWEDEEQQNEAEMGDGRTVEDAQTVFEAASSWDEHASEDAKIKMPGEPKETPPCTQCGAKQVVETRQDAASPGELFCATCWAAFDAASDSDAPVLLINLSKVDTEGSIFVEKLSEERAAQVTAAIQQKLSSAAVKDLFDADSLCFHSNKQTFVEDTDSLQTEYSNCTFGKFDYPDEEEGEKVSVLWAAIVRKTRWDSVNLIKQMIALTSRPLKWKRDVVLEVERLGEECAERAARYHLQTRAKTKKQTTLLQLQERLQMLAIDQSGDLLRMQKVRRQLSKLERELDGLTNQVADTAAAEHLSELGGASDLLGAVLCMILDYVPKGLYSVHHLLGVDVTFGCPNQKTHFQSLANMHGAVCKEWVEDFCHLPVRVEGGMLQKQIQEKGESQKRTATKKKKKKKKKQSKAAAEIEEKAETATSVHTQLHSSVSDSIARAWGASAATTRGEPPLPPDTSILSACEPDEEDPGSAYEDSPLALVQGLKGLNDSLKGPSVAISKAPTGGLQASHLTHDSKKPTVSNAIAAAWGKKK